MVKVALSMEKFLELFPPTHKNYKVTYKGGNRTPDLEEIEPAWFVEMVLPWKDSRGTDEPRYIYLGPCLDEKHEQVLGSYWCNSPLENW